MTTSPRSLATKLTLLLSTTLATVAAGIAGCSATTAEPAHVPPPPTVTVVESRRQTVPVVATPIGTTRALEDVTIRARVKGFLTQKHFQDGGPVKKGQLLLVIDEIPYKIAVDQAKANVDVAEALVKKAQASKTREVNKAQLALDQAQLLLDQVEERRSRNLLARSAASREDFDKSEAQRKKTEAQVQGDEAKVEEAASDYQIDIDRAKADLEGYRAVLADAKLNLEYCRMFAPIDGRIGELKVKVGNMVGESGQTELVTIQQLNPMGLDLRPAALYLPIATALQKAGLEVELDVEGGPRHPQKGKTIFIDNTVDSTTSTFLVRAEVPNPTSSLLPGQYIKATITIGYYDDAVVVPEQSVVNGQNGWSVYVVSSDDTVKVVPVKPIDVYQGLRVIESGLEPGQKVIVDDVRLVRQGQKVKTELVPLDTYVRVETSTDNIDQRFNSPITRIPGLEPSTTRNPNRKPSSEPAPARPDSPASPPKPPASAPTQKAPAAAPAPKTAA